MEASRSRIFENSIFIFLSVLASGILVFLTIILVARDLGATAFGQFSFILALCSIIQLFADGGFISITIRNISTHKEKLTEIVGNALTVMLLTSVIFFFVSLVALLFVDTNLEFKLSLIVMLLAAFSMLQGLVYGAAIRAMEDMGITAIASVVHKIFLLLFVWLAIITEQGLLGIAVAHLISNFCYSFVLSYIVNIKYGRTFYRVNLQLWNSIIIDSIPLGLAMLLRKLTVHLDTLFLILLSTVAAVGIYSSAYRTLQMVEVAAVALSGVLFPVMSRLAKESHKSLVELFNQSFFILMTLSLPLSIWFSLASENLILIFYGDEYADAKNVLAVLGIALFLPVLASLNHPLFTAINKQKLLMFAALISLTLNVLLDIILIPRYSSFGAAIGTACTEALICILGLVLLHKNNIYLTNYRKLFYVVLSSVFSGYVYSLLPADQGIIFEALRLVVFFTSYVAALYILRVFVIDDIRVFLGYLVKAKGTPDATTLG